MAAGEARTVAVIAATGRTGRHAVRFLHEKEGVRVVAVARNEEKMKDLFGGLEGVEFRVADLRDQAALQAALEGVQVVVATPGLVLGGGCGPYTSDSRIYIDAAENVTGAMKANGIKRLVWMSTEGAQVEGDAFPGGLSCLINVMRCCCLGRLIDDQREALHVVMDSGLDWTAVRPGDLVEGDGGAKLKHGMHGDFAPTSIARADVARFMVDQVFSDALIHKAPIISPDAEE